MKTQPLCLAISLATSIIFATAAHAQLGGLGGAASGNLGGTLSGGMNSINGSLNGGLGASGAIDASRTTETLRERKARLKQEALQKTEQAKEAAEQAQNSASDNNPAAPSPASTAVGGAATANGAINGSSTSAPTITLPPAPNSGTPNPTTVTGNATDALQSSGNNNDTSSAQRLPQRPDIGLRSTDEPTEPVRDKAADTHPAPSSTLNGNGSASGIAQVEHGDNHTSASVGASYSTSARTD